MSDKRAWPPGTLVYLHRADGEICGEGVTLRRPEQIGSAWVVWLRGMGVPYGLDRVSFRGAAGSRAGE